MLINKQRMVTTREVVSYCAPRYARGRALDIGAGTAKYRGIIEKYADKYETCDIVAGPHIDYVEDVTKGLRFSDGSFHTIFSFQTLEHVRSPDKMVSEMYRCLAKNGICILTVPFLVGGHSDPGDYQRYTVQGLQELFMRHNFEILEAESYGGLFSVIGEMIKFLFLSPYAPQHSRIKRAIVTRIMQLCYFLDRFHIGRAPNFYPNVYIIARK